MATTETTQTAARSRKPRKLPIGMLIGLAALAVAALYPVLYEEMLGDMSIPVFREWPSVSTAVIMIVFIMMAVGLNIVVGYSGLLDLGYVAFYAVGAYTAGWLASGHFQQVKIHILSSGVGAGPARHPRQHVDRPPDRRLDHGDRRHPHRPAHAAAARRLPGDRDARLRRDHPPVRAQRRQSRRLQPDGGDVRDQPDRLARLRPGAERLARPARSASSSRSRRSTSSTGPRSSCSCSRSSARSGSATRASGAPGSPSARTRPRPRRWACRSCAPRPRPTRSAPSSAASPGPSTRASRAAPSRASSSSTSRSSCSAWSSSAGWAASGGSSSPARSSPT